MERSQSKKGTYYMIPTIWDSGKGKTMEIVKRSVVARALGEMKGSTGGAQKLFRTVKILCLTL